MNKKQRLPEPAVIALAAVVTLVVAILGYLLLVHPKSVHAAKLGHEIDATQAQLVQARIAEKQAKLQQPIRIADLFRLVKAMPDSQDMAGILLQLSGVANDTGITFESIRPGPPVPMTGYQVVPITLNFSGNFYDLSDFLLRLRNLVTVHHGRLDALGRLFAVDTLSFGQAKTGFPQIEATLTVDSFIYGTPAPAPGTTPTPATTTSTTDTTATTTTTTDTTATTTTPAPTPPSAATAAGATP